MGVEIVEKACQVPCKLIADNAGHEGAVVVGNLLRLKDEKMGFNAQTGCYVNMIEAGGHTLRCMRATPGTKRYTNSRQSKGDSPAQTILNKKRGNARHNGRICRRLGLTAHK